MGRKELFYFDFFSVRPTEITGKNKEQHFDIKKKWSRNRIAFVTALVINNLKKLNNFGNFGNLMRKFYYNLTTSLVCTAWTLSGAKNLCQ